MFNNHPIDNESDTVDKKQKKQLESTKSNDNLETENLDRSLVLWSPGGIQDIAVLHQGFNLHRMPSNYLTRKSYVEQLIYHATMSDRMKSPFSRVSQSSELGLRCSTNVHPSLPLPSSILPPSPIDKESDESPCLDLKLHDSSKSESSSIEPPQSSGSSKPSNHMSWSSSSSNFLHTATWHLQDLSFLVGSDLAIFGTPKHPCVSLKLSPAHESINVLTGIDIWLENIINEVPEVAMCYHHEGIVMQEYEIYKTSEIPEVSGFETEQIYRIIQNLVMFLKRNATQEGHTYWLVKEPGLGVVKLYDLTNLGLKDVDESWSLGEDADGNPIFYDTNPFILPVAILCYKLAERRFIEYSDYRQRQFSESEPCDPDFNQMDVVMDTLRLAKNCLNLLSVLENAVLVNKDTVTQMPPGFSDLKSRAILLLCQLYLITPADLISACIRKLQNLVCPTDEETVSVSVDDFNSMENSFPVKTTPTSIEHESPSSDSNWIVEKPPSYLQSVRKLMGNSMIEALKSSNVTHLSQLASSILEQYGDPNPYSSPEPNSALELQQAYRNQTEQGSEEASHLACLLYSSNQKPDSHCLPLVLLKSYINRSQVLWARLHPQLYALPSNATANPHDHAQTMFRHLIPALLLLEHIIPDKHTILLSSPNDVHSSKPACPNCSLAVPKSVLNLTDFDRHFLADALNAVSSLFARLVVCYPDILRTTNSADTGSTNKIQSISLPSSSDRLLLRSACSQSLNILDSYVKSAILGPVQLDSVQDLPDAYAKCELWLKLLERALTCLHRSLSRSQSRKDRQSSRKQTEKHFIHGQDSMTSSENSSIPVTASGDFCHPQKFMVPDWWFIMTNMFVSGLRNLFLVMSNQNQDQDQFKFHLLRGLNLLNTTPVKPADLSETSEFLRNSSEFQFYKLCALYFQQHSMTLGIEFTKKFLSSRVTASSILPSEALYPKTIVQSSSKNPVDCDSISSFNDSTPTLVGICLARAIEAQLRQLTSAKYAADDSLPVWLCVDLLRASNEYLQIQFEYSNSVEESKTSRLNLLHNVLKLVIKHLPSKLITNSSTLVTTHLDSDLTSGSFCFYDPQIVRNLVILRLNQLKLTLFRFHDGVSFKRQKSQIPSWFNLVNQIRSTLNWHILQMSYSTRSRAPTDDAIKIHSTKPSIEDCLKLAFDQKQIELVDLVLHLCLTSHLVSWQSVNQDVLSASGLITILRDVHTTLPIVKTLEKCLPNCDCSLISEDLTSAFNTIRANLARLVNSLAEKSTLHAKRDQNVKTKKKHKSIASSSSNVSDKSTVCSMEQVLLQNLNKIPDPVNICTEKSDERLCANLVQMCKDFLARLNCVSDYLNEA